MPKRVDANQPEIIEKVRAFPGVSVHSLHKVGGGFPDIIVGFKEHNYLFEIKTEGGLVNKKQFFWLMRWRGQAQVARSADEILKTIGAIT